MSGAVAQWKSTGLVIRGFCLVQVRAQEDRVFPWERNFTDMVPLDLGENGYLATAGGGFKGIYRVEGERWDPPSNTLH